MMCVLAVVQHDFDLFLLNFNRLYWYEVKEPE